MGRRCTISIDFSRNPTQFSGRLALGLAGNPQRGMDPAKLTGRTDESVVAVRAFHPFVPLLRLDAESGDRAGFETADADRFVRFFAKAVGAVV
jgi:hypothetical protein